MFSSFDSSIPPRTKVSSGVTVTRVLSSRVPITEPCWVDLIDDDLFLQAEFLAEFSSQTQ